jgi:hypothetical protein
MHPAGGPPQPDWVGGLPASLASCFGSVPFDEVRSRVEPPLAAANITAYELWWCDVPEWFTSAEDLGRRLTGTRPSPPEATAPQQVIAGCSDVRGGCHYGISDWSRNSGCRMPRSR